MSKFLNARPNSVVYSPAECSCPKVSKLDLGCCNIEQKTLVRCVAPGERFRVQPLVGATYPR